MQWETVVTSEFFGRKIKLLIVSARPSEEGEQRDGAARSVSAVKATLALAEGELAPHERAGAFRRFQGHPGCSGGGGSRGSGEGDKKAEQKWEGDKVAGADLL